MSKFARYKINTPEHDMMHLYQVGLMTDRSWTGIGHSFAPASVQKYYKY